MLDLVKRINLLHMNSLCTFLCRALLPDRKIIFFKYLPSTEQTLVFKCAMLEDAYPRNSIRLNSRTVDLH